MPTAALLPLEISSTWLILIALVLGILIGILSFMIISRMRQTQTKPSPLRPQSSAPHHAIEAEHLPDLSHPAQILPPSPNYQRDLDSVLNLSISILEVPGTSTVYLASSVLLFSSSPGQPVELSVGTARRFSPADMQVILPGTSGLIGDTIAAGIPTLSSQISRDPELSRITALKSCSVAYCIPLRSPSENLGVLLFAHPDPNYFTRERREILGLIANQAVVAIQNARLYRDLEQEKERMVVIQEEARKKLARDLHDGPTQAVASIAMRVNYARRLLGRDVPAASVELLKIEDLARSTTKEIRHMLFTLRPLILESQGLVAALQDMADKLRDTYNQNVTISADPSIPPTLETGKQAVIFYIAEEAVTNARKHAQAANIWVRLKLAEKDLVLLEVEDNGVGFNISAVDAYYEQRGSLGLVNMRERAELVNCTLHIDSAEGQGTRIRALIPLTPYPPEQPASSKV